MVEATGSAHLFVYGSLTRPGALDQVIGRRHAGERLRARLEGYARVQADGWEDPCVVPRGAWATDGILVMDLTAEDFARLDAFEEVPNGQYTRTLVEVDAAGCGPTVARLAAWCYVAGPRLLDRLGDAAGGELGARKATGSGAERVLQS